MTTPNTIPGLDEARAEHTAALAAREAIQQRHAAALAAVIASQAARAEVVHRIAAGEAVSVDESTAATAIVTTADAHAKMIGDALKTQDKASLKAAEKIERIIKRWGYKKLADAVEARIALAEEASAIGAQMASWLTRWKGNEADIHTAHSTSKRGGFINSGDLGNMRFAAGFVPSEFQSSIAVTGSVVTYDLAASIRVTWQPVLEHARRHAVETE